VACWRRGERYVVRDLDGRQVTRQEARRTIAQRYTVPPDRRRKANGATRPRQHRTSRRSKESQGAPSAGPSNPNATTPSQA
jgi:hypothetical protein